MEIPGIVPVAAAPGGRQVVRKGGKDCFIHAPPEHGGLVGLFTLAVFHPALRGRGQTAHPGEKRIDHLAG